MFRSCRRLFFISFSHHHQFRISPPETQRINMSSSPIKTNGYNSSQPQQLKVKRLTEFALIPTRGSKQAAGYDLYSAYEAVVPARGKALVKTDIATAIPAGYYGRVAPRSGLAWKNSLDVGAGVIDEDYRGNVGVILFNHSDVEFKVSRGDRIAQLILEKIITPEVVEVENLDETERNAGGFGSTGVSNGVSNGITTANN